MCAVLPPVTPLLSQTSLEDQLRTNYATALMHRNVSPYVGHFRLYGLASTFEPLAYK